MKLSVAVLVFAAALPLAAQHSPVSLPDSPSQALAAKKRVAAPVYNSRNIHSARPTFRREDSDLHERAFLLLSTAAMASTLADIELTAHCLKTNPNCREANPLYGSHPSRARLYATAVPVTVAQIWFSNHLRKRYPNRKLWMIPTVSVTAVHSLGAMSTRF